MKMKIMKYQVRFTTPAFLGDADQSGRWRTPPFKALLRQWWRVAVAKDLTYDHRRMREVEGELFGNAWLEGNFSKSLIRIRLDNWSEGKTNVWPNTEKKVAHPEVKNREGKVVHVGSQLYMGYGPLTYRKGTALKANAAIQAGETATLSLAVPDDLTDVIGVALTLMNAYGTLGGRSRNGWGSFVLTPLKGTPALNLDTSTFTRPVEDALQLDWPHAIGADEKGPLIWKARVFDDWKVLMRDLAEIKIALRTKQFPFHSGKNAAYPEDRHWLSYPVTNHSVKSWGSARLPNSLRFKARPDPRNPKTLHAVIFQVPCLPPADFNPDPASINRVWRQVHAFLDQRGLARIEA